MKYSTLGVHPQPFILAIAYGLLFIFVFGGPVTGGFIFQYWYLFILLVVAICLLPLAFTRTSFRFVQTEDSANLIVETWKGEYHTLVGPLILETFWNYNFRGKSGLGMGFDSIETYEKRQQANDVYVWMKIVDHKGKEQFFYEVIKAQTKFPNNHRYEHRNLEIKNAIQVYNVDELIDFLEKAEF